MRLLRRPAPLPFLPALLLLAGGCGGDGVTSGGEAGPRAATVTGTVTLDGSGAPGAVLTLGTTPSRSATSGPDGAFRFDGVPEGNWTLVLAPPDGGVFPDTSRAVGVAAGASIRADFHGTLPRTAVLEGHVAAGGVPLAEVGLELSGPESRSGATDSAGAFRFEGLIRGEYRLRLVGVDPARWSFPDTVRAVRLGTGAAAALDFAGVRVPRPPDPPGVAAVPLTPRTVRVTWLPDDGAEVEGYRLERRSGNDPWTAMASPAAGDSAWEDSAVEPGGSYGYRVEACNDDGCSGPSEAVEVTTPLDPPSPPEALTASPIGPDRVRLRWRDASDDETGFRLRRRTDGGDWTLLATVPAGVTLKVDSGLEAGTEYVYQVQSCGEGGCSEFTEEASVRTLDEPPPAPSSPAAEALSPTEVRVTWVDPEGVVEEVRVERKVEGGSWTAVGIRPPGTGRLDDGAALPATLHTYRLRACNSGGCSPWTAEVEVTPPQAPPPAPASLSAAASGGERIDLSWQAGGGTVDEVQVERRVGAGSWTPLATLEGNATSHADTDVTAGSLHRYRVRACNEAGCSPFSGEASATPVASDLNLSVEAVHLNQVVQTLGGGVPLVAGRGGVLRVFVKANLPNTARPDVRVRLFHGATQVASHTLAAPGSSVPQDPDLTIFGDSWNVTVPGLQVVPGLSVLVEVDPAGAVPESERSDNAWPAPGSPQPLDVREVPPFRVRFVPVHQSATGLTGSVNAGSLLGDALQLYPLRDADADVRLPYTTSLDSLKSNDSNGAWTALLSELNALRVAEGSDRHYYGVVRTTYSSGIAGYGYVGGRTAVGWDRSGASWVAAHEWGHNFGRRHAPCGVSNPDGSFPYAGGVIGVPGWNGSSLVSTGTKDLMGYCSPRWISDYTYEAVLAHRGAAGAAWTVAAGSTAPAGAPVSGWGTGAAPSRPGFAAAGVDAPAPPVPVLVLWGRMDRTGTSGILEPAFQVVAPPVVPRGGSAVVEGLDPSGALLFSLPFEPELTGEEDGGHFALALPLDAFPVERLATLRLRSGGRELARREASAYAPATGAPTPPTTPDPGGVRATGLIPGDPRSGAVRTAGGGLEIRWDAGRTPLLVVRDPATGQILSLARGGRVVLPRVPGALEWVASDGVLSRRGALLP